MKYKIISSALVIYLMSCFLNLYGENLLLNQKKGIWQGRVDKQIQLVNFRKINFSFDQVPLKKVKKVLLHKGCIFILDGYRNEIYVIDKTGKYLYSVGRPGQGPGDLEYPADMFISNEDKIYVINSLPKRIEIFDLKGKPIGTVKLDMPWDSPLPKSIIVNKNKSFVIGSSYNHLVAHYNNIGDYQETILSTKQKYDYSKSIFAVATRIGVNRNNGILHFDAFNGIFTIISPSGNPESVFQAYNELSDKKSKFLEKEFSQTPSSSGSHSKSINLTVISLWTNFVVDNQGKIFVIPLSRTKEQYQKLFVFAHDGKFLYSKPLDYFKKMQVQNISYDNDSFMFRTQNLDLIIANRRKN